MSHDIVGLYSFIMKIVHEIHSKYNKNSTSRHTEVQDNFIDITMWKTVWQLKQTISHLKTVREQTRHSGGSLNVCVTTKRLDFYQYTNKVAANNQ